MGFKEVKMGAPGQRQCKPQESRSQSSGAPLVMLRLSKLLQLTEKRLNVEERLPRPPVWTMSPSLLSQRLRFPRHPTGEASESCLWPQEKSELPAQARLNEARKRKAGTAAALLGGENTLWLDGMDVPRLCCL